MVESAVGKTVFKLTLVVIAMFAFVFVVMVPLYNVLCDVLGLNGKTDGRRYEVTSAQPDLSRELDIQFVALNNENMSWTFKPNTTVLKVNPGAVNDVSYFAENSEAINMIAQAIPSISPSRAAEYFHKTECFCFNQQALAAGESIDMPLQFIVDKDLPKDIKTITLSYTLFDVTEGFNAVALR